MNFRLVPNLVTLNDLEQHNNPQILRYFAKFGSFWGALREIVEDTQILSVTEM